MEADKVGWTETKTWKSTKSCCQTKTGRLLSIQIPQSYNRGTSFFLCFTKTTRQTISQLDADMQGVNSGVEGEKQNKTKAERETVKRKKDGWQCVGGSLSSSFGEAFCWQQDRHLSSPPPPISSLSVDLADMSLNNTSSLVCNYPSLSFSLYFFPFFAYFIVSFLPV